MANVGIVYSTVNHILRRVIFPTDDAELNDPAHVSPGETLLIVTTAEYQASKSVEELVLSKTGKLPADPRCVVTNVLTGKVDAVICADPLLDTLPGATLTASPSVVA